MRWNLKRALLGTFLVVAALTSWWLAQTITEGQPPLLARSTDDPDYTMDNFRAAVMNAEGMRKYTLAAESMEHYPHNDTTRLTNPHLIQYDISRAPVHTWADLGLLNRQKKEIVMTGNVRMLREWSSSERQTEMTTNEMRILLN
ncbi:MAG: LPS export ABC transporter periplasmic protein LptC [Acidiferrobacterales bacterium]